MIPLQVDVTNSNSAQKSSVSGNDTATGRDCSQYEQDTPKCSFPLKATREIIMDNSIGYIEQSVWSIFKGEYGSAPEQIILSPGRVNIIGEHTGYNDGYVLPIAIDRYLVMAFGKRDDDVVRVVSTDVNEKIEFRIGEIKKGQFDWGEYITGCFRVLLEQGKELSGFDMVITSNIPVGTSLSSSAALELGILRAISYSSDLDWDPLQMALLGQKVDSKWLGVNGGVMDQVICGCGKKDHALLIDCRDLSLQLCQLPDTCSIVVMDTTTRGLFDSAFSERRRQCLAAARAMDIDSLRDGSMVLLETSRKNMDKPAYLRAHHIISENRRVLKAAEAMQDNAVVELGKLMYESHCSLRDDFDVSGEALNAVVECAVTHPACMGARMTGAGFAGCAVALVIRGHEDNFVRYTTEQYRAKMNVEPRLHVCRATDGTTMKDAG